MAPIANKNAGRMDHSSGIYFYQKNLLCLLRWGEGPGAETSPPRPLSALLSPSSISTMESRFLFRVILSKTRHAKSLLEKKKILLRPLFFTIPQKRNSAVFCCAVPFSSSAFIPENPVFLQKQGFPLQRSRQIPRPPLSHAPADTPPPDVALPPAP